MIFPKIKEIRKLEKFAKIEPQKRQSLPKQLFPTNPHPHENSPIELNPILSEIATEKLRENINENGDDPENRRLIKTEENLKTLEMGKIDLKIEISQKNVNTQDPENNPTGNNSKIGENQPKIDKKP